jgi:hypothetical protein
LATACVPRKPPTDVFDAPGLSDAQWKRVQLECDYEAKKAVAPQKPGLARHLDWRDIYLKCLELKGAERLGTTDDFPEFRH